MRKRKNKVDPYDGTGESPEVQRLCEQLRYMRDVREGEKEAIFDPEIFTKKEWDAIYGDTSFPVSVLEWCAERWLLILLVTAMGGLGFVLIAVLFLLAAGFYFQIVGGLVGAMNKRGTNKK